MKKLSQSQIILKHLEDLNDWIPSYELCKVNTKYGWIGLAGDRRARELAEKGQIEVRHSGKYAEYRRIGELDGLETRGLTSNKEALDVVNQMNRLYKDANPAPSGQICPKMPPRSTKSPQDDPRQHQNVLSDYRGKLMQGKLL